MIFLTAYFKRTAIGLSRYAGPEIEAESWDEAQAIAQSLVKLEKMQDNPTFGSLRVVAELLAVSE